MRNEREVFEVTTIFARGTDDVASSSPQAAGAGDQGKDAAPPEAPTSLEDEIPHQVSPEIKKAMLAAAYGRQLVDRLAALQDEEVTKYTGISRSELGLRVWNAPLGQVAYRLGIKKHLLMRICKLYEVPTPPKGYFNTSFANRSIRWTRVSVARDSGRL